MLAKKNTALKTERVTKSPKRKQAQLIITSAIGAIAIGALMLFIIGAVLQQTEKQKVFVVQENIESGTKIDTSNMDKYVKIKEVPVEYLPEGYLSAKKEIKNTFINGDYVAGQIILEKDCDKQEDILKGIENPVEVSLSVSKIDAAVGGILREGDFINIYTIKSSVSGYSAEQIMHGAFITKALDSSGKRIDKSNKDSNATVLNLVIPMAIEKEFNQEVANGNIRIGLIYDKDTDSINSTLDVKTDNTDSKTDTAQAETTKEYKKDLTSQELVDLISSSEKNNVIEYYGVDSIAVSGTILATELDANNQIILILEDNNKGYSMKAVFDPSTFDVNSITVGQQIKISGKMAVDSMVITLNECTVQ